GRCGGPRREVQGAGLRPYAQGGVLDDQDAPQRARPRHAAARQALPRAAFFARAIGPGAARRRRPPAGVAASLPCATKRADLEYLRNLLKDERWIATPV